MNGIGSTIFAAWRIATPYFKSEDKWAGRGLLAAVIAIALALVGIDVLINQWNSRFYNALQERNWDTFVREIIVFSILAASSVALQVYQLYLRQWLEIRWRKWLTEHLLHEWLDGPNHYRMQLLGDAADNPDQRIADDTKLFVERTLILGIGLLKSVVTLISFIAILWALSNAAPLHMFGRDIDIPGYLVWGAIIYAILGTVLTHLIGRPLVALDFRQQHFEADFRFNLVRVRENSEQIALIGGDTAERQSLTSRFANVVANWLGIMKRTKKVTAFTASYSQASVIFPYVLVAPAYFAEKIQLGGMMQTASAFSSVQDSLSFFVSAYRDLADWQAIVSRIDGFQATSARAKALGTNPDGIQVTASATDAIKLHDLSLQLPNGQPLIDSSNLNLDHRQATLLTGPSGAGKSTLFRAIAGLWPFGRGTVEIPSGASVMMLPQRPYFPIGTLAAAISYPSKEGTYDDSTLRDALNMVGLPALAERLSEDAHWNRMLSLGEQQRLGIARALLGKPQYLFLDEATASLDEPSEAMLYRLLADKLPCTTVISIGHRTTLEALHARKVTLQHSGQQFRIGDAARA